MIIVIYRCFFHQNFDLQGFSVAAFDYQRVYIGILSGLWGQKRSALLRGLDRSAEIFIALRSWDFFISSMHFETTLVTQCHVNGIGWMLLVLLQHVEH